MALILQKGTCSPAALPELNEADGDKRIKKEWD
jgi:hypothetical protein